MVRLAPCSSRPFQDVGSRPNSDAVALRVASLPGRLGSVAFHGMACACVRSSSSSVISPSAIAWIRPVKTSSASARSSSVESSQSIVRTSVAPIRCSLRPTLYVSARSPRIVAIARSRSSRVAMNNGIVRSAVNEHPIMCGWSQWMCDGVVRPGIGWGAGMGRRSPGASSSRRRGEGGRVIQADAWAAVKRSAAHAATSSGVSCRSPSSHQSASPNPRAPNRADAVPAKVPPELRDSVSSTRRSCSRRSSGSGAQVAAHLGQERLDLLLRAAHVEVGRELVDVTVHVVAAVHLREQREMLDRVVDAVRAQVLVGLARPDDEPAHARAGDVGPPDADAVDLGRHRFVEGHRRGTIR